jgi:SPP1 gp7 family putative phage head morphogenesis protein
MLQLPRSKAPKHPTAPERKMRAAVAGLLRPAAQALAAAIASGDLFAMYDAAMVLQAELDRDRFDDCVRVAASDTAESARVQVASLLGLPADDFDPGLDGELEQLVDRLHEITTGAAADLVDRAEELLDEDEPPSQEDAHEALAGVIGAALARTSLSFAWGFSRFNRAAQRDAGVDSYRWQSMHDNRVRPEHEHLDGIEFDWDDPPLGADESSNGEDCHPGDDYNCRCVAVPVVREAENEAKDDDDVVSADIAYDEAA